ncbi:indole-3-glycerol phosphate synthase TrpC [Aquifex aeolicus]|uniref:Indole-3-glycerol phosphate synthase n=1 Tax=Aquifex aeolicus (strain VF5) TaxID=224324 RepID=TRPC_AQUAE|nr:indole-3-glycerol phosphate synthase TrpC [Aquifex aeolicus]O67657.1 RecName: Full=Indole-3-glycerol phosphate synthase; Short=IGPS [Aquifex aeolicus VF5]AAC07616.1 indole-3-glycerol phosphate synthase [Aquifex aeolicus VF5]
MGFLEEVRSYKESQIDTSPEYLRKLEELIEERKEFYDFEKALTSCGTKIIAEVKKASPSEGNIKEVNPEEQAKLYEKAGAIAISVLTDEKYFKGSLEDLRNVRESVKLPLLRKDFTVHKVQILEAKAYGADIVLLIVRMLSDKELKELLDFSEELGLSPLVEVFTLDEAKRALDAGAKIIGINNRDLETFKVDINKTKELAPKIKDLGAKFVISESGISKREEILELMNYQVDGFLIGTSLMKSENPYRKLKELLGF